MYRSFNPENWIRRHIREAYQDDEPTLEISGIPVCQNDGIRSSTASYPTFPGIAVGILAGPVDVRVAQGHVRKPILHVVVV
jgi:hypothetical protein